MGTTPICLTNGLNKVLELWLEALGDMVPWPAGMTIEISSVEAAEPAIEQIRWDQGRVTVFGWFDRITEVNQTGKPILLWSSPPPESSRE